jgi:hypothetical protein
MRKGAENAVLAREPGRDPKATITVVIHREKNGEIGVYSPGQVRVLIVEPDCPTRTRELPRLGTVLSMPAALKKEARWLRR